MSQELVAKYYQLYFISRKNLPGGKHDIRANSLCPGVIERLKERNPCILAVIFYPIYPNFAFCKGNPNQDSTIRGLEGLWVIIEVE